MADNSIKQSTPATAASDASVANIGNKTEDQMLADILRASPIAEAAGLDQESLPEKQDDVPAPSEVQDDDDQDTPEVSDEEEVEEPVEEVETVEDDQESTQDPEVYEIDDLDDFSVNVKIDGETTPVKLSELVKGYATDQSLSKKGRELGDARKALDEEREAKIKEIDNIAHAANGILLKSEEKFAKEFHSFDAKIKEAKEDGDTLKAAELREEKTEAQEKYWSARKEREALLEQASKQKASIEQEQFSKKLDKFEKEITSVIPDWSETVAGEIRQFALDKGLPEELISSMVDVNAIKFVDDFRRSEAKKAVGATKRKTAPAKAVPMKKGKPVSEKKKDANNAMRDKVLAGQGSSSDNEAFLRNLAARHFE